MMMKTLLRDVGIRSACALDAAKIAACQTKSWQQTYAGMMPKAYLDSPLAAHLKTYWPAKLSSMKPLDVVLIAEAKVELCGFIAVWSELSSTGLGFVDNLHVLGPAKGQGIGRFLMASAAHRLVEDGHRGLYLTVAASNEAAIAFYGRLGGKIVDRFVKPVHGHELDLLRYHWADLEVLAGAGR